MENFSKKLFSPENTEKLIRYIENKKTGSQRVGFLLILHRNNHLILQDCLNIKIALTLGLP